MPQEDHETSLADAIRPRPAEDDARSGCGSKLWPRWRGGDTWWRRGWGEATKKPERLEKSLSSLLSPRHTLWPLSLHPSVCAGPERLLGDTVPHPTPPPIHPSISASFILHQRTQAHCLPPPSLTVTYFICLHRQGEFVRLSSSLPPITGRSCRSSHTGSSARGGGMSSFPDSAQFPSYPSVKDTSLWLQRRAAKNFAS